MAKLVGEVKGSSMSETLHLDLGCGSVPRNPYLADRVMGLDLFAAPAIGVASANLAVESIPFDDEKFDSVSAYDFFEHIPRVSICTKTKVTTFPFIKLMNEVHRVLKLGGYLYASTPCYPHAKTFVDPTHVNPITMKTVRYFAGESPLARMYGYTGNFSVARVVRYHPRVAYEPRRPGFIRTCQRWSELFTGAASHVLWELQKTG